MCARDRRKKSMSRGDNFVAEPTGSATMVNVDGRQESDREGKPVTSESKN